MNVRTCIYFKSATFQKQRTCVMIITCHLLKFFHELVDFVNSNYRLTLPHKRQQQSS